MLHYDLKKLQDVVVDFNKITGIMIVLYDEHFNIVYNYPPKMTPFCKKLRLSAPGMTVLCHECDRIALLQCQARKELNLYRCHFGLSEAVVPIVEGNTPVGYLMIGGVVRDMDRTQIMTNIKNLRHVSEEDKTELLQLLSRSPSVTDDILTAAAKILEMCACYLIMQNIVEPQQTELYVLIDRYIKKSLSSSTLSLTDICKQFSITRSTLYAVSSRHFGMGISNYIRHCRIEYAKKLLLKNEFSIAQISVKCGFSAPNRFTKTFKQMTGILPKHYARQLFDQK